MFEIKNCPELTFEEEKHIYRLNGLPIPSVTTLMKPLSNAVYGGIDSAVLSKAAGKGTSVHSAIEIYTKYGIEDVEPEFKPYFDAFLKWYSDYKVVPFGSEVRLYHKEMLYAGTADLLASVNGADTLIDFKTSASTCPMLYPVQLEAYAKALVSMYGNEANIRRKAIVHLKSDGNYEVLEYAPRDMEAWRVFTALLSIHNYKRKFNYI